jgi:fucose 4-O-acetylase-like acetyltransferase
MMKTIKNKYREFVVNLRIYSLNITIMAAVLLIFVFLGSTSYLYMQSPSTIAHRQELEEYFSQANAKLEWKRLHKYHGYPSVVVYQEGKTPYFYDKQGSKCAFIYPPKGAGLITHQAEDSEHYAALTLNKEPLIK